MKRRMYLLPLAFAVLLFVCPVPAKATDTAAENTVLCDSGEWQPSRSALPWETVICRGIVELAGDGEQILRCRLDEGLDFGTVISVACGGEAVNASFYTIVTARLEDESAFVLHLSAGAGRKGDLLEIRYTVRLNDRSSIGGSGNRFRIELSDGKGRTRTGKEGAVFSWSIQVCCGVLIPETPGQSNPVSGACLCLYKDPELRQRVGFTVRRNDEYLACLDDGCPHTRHTYVMRTPGNGTFLLEGLEAGTYYLRETRPPDGMTAAAETAEVTVTEEGAVFTSGVLCENGVVRILHTTGTARKTKRRRSLLDWYRIGSRIIAAVLAVLVATRRYYLY